MLLVFSLCHFRVKIFSKRVLASNKTGTNSQSGVVSLFGQYAYHLPRDTNARTCGNSRGIPKPCGNTGQMRQSGVQRNRSLFCFRASALPALVQHLQDTKHQYGWTQEEPRTDGGGRMTFLIGSLPYLATWLLPFAGAVTILKPRELPEHMRELAQRAYAFFVVRSETGDART